MSELASQLTPTITEFEEVVAQRRSIRGFLPEPVANAVLRKVFALAQQAPSNCNVQPWQVVVASGEPCREISRKLQALIAAGGPMPTDYKRVEKFEGVMRQRQIDTAVKLYGNMGIARDDKEGRIRAMMRNYEFFDAPHIAFLGMDKVFGETVALDVGMYAQTLMLAMTAYGIGSCAQAAVSRHPDAIREHFGLPDNLGILMGISFGYEDTDIPANRTVVPRASIDENVNFVS
jgi:hypothetical protein